MIVIHCAAILGTCDLVMALANMCNYMRLGANMIYALTNKLVFVVGSVQYLIHHTTILV